MAGAVQCGFCIPGMVMSAKGLLDTNPAPTREEAAYAIRNNICRCTGYVKIIDGILLAAELFRKGEAAAGAATDWSPGPAGPPGGRARRRSLGTGIYPDDIYLDGMIYGSAVRSQYPRARVLAIHTEEARALPGVVGVLTAEDIPGQNKVGHLVKDWDTMIAVGDITHYLGDAICLVAAETPEILAQAKALVKVDYEELPMVRNPREAMLPDAPLVHRTGNLLTHKHIQRGNRGGGHRQIEARADPALLHPLDGARLPGAGVRRGLSRRGRGHDPLHGPGRLRHPARDHGDAGIAGGAGEGAATAWWAAASAARRT